MRLRRPQPLQNFNFKVSQYERPNQKWVCGKRGQGCPCAIGPDKKGRCRADFECKPKNKNSDSNSWSCTRSKALGNICSDGPLPDGTCCHPITPCCPTRSIRYKQSLAIKWVSIVTFGMLLIFISGFNNQKFISPGDLTYQHANNAECSSCHSVFDQGITGWLHKAFKADNILENNAQCLKCHQFGLNAADAHSLPQAELKKIAHSTISNQESPEYQKIACMSCHVEHHGTNANLVKVNSQDCALCHDLPTKHGRKIHPNFRHYPYKRRTGIVYDHTRHENKHFLDKSGENRKEHAPGTGSCLTCHKIDNNGVKIVVRDYQKICQDCHNDSSFEVSEAFAFITVPDLNEDHISSLSTYWPEETGEELTPFMKLMISNDKKVLSILSTMKDGDLIDLEEISTQFIAGAIKKLFYDIYINGESAIAVRLANAYQCQLNENGNLIHEPACKLTVNKFQALLNSLSLPLFCKAQQEWFPDLRQENNIKDFIHNQWSLTNKKEDYYCDKLLKNQNSETELESWSLDGFAMSYRVTRHSDDFFKSWLEATRNFQGSQSNDYFRREIFSLLTSKDTAGQCNKCHSIDKLDAENYVIHWKALEWNPKLKDFIRFNHAGHLLNQEEKVCVECHKINKKADYLKSYKDDQPLQFESNFSTKKDTCEACHLEAMEQNQCQTCHNYHVSELSGDASLKQNQMGIGHLKIWTDKSDFNVGDQMTIKFSVDLPMYVRIVRIDTSGEILHLFPNIYRLEHYCKPGVIYHIPKLGSGRTLDVKPPAGLDKLLGVGSPNPITENDLFFNQQDEFDEQKMRGYTVRATHFIRILEKP